MGAICPNPSFELLIPEVSDFNIYLDQARWCLPLFPALGDKCCLLVNCFSGCWSDFFVVHETTQRCQIQGHEIVFDNVWFIMVQCMVHRG